MSKRIAYRFTKRGLDRREAAAWAKTQPWWSKGLEQYMGPGGYWMWLEILEGGD